MKSVRAAMHYRDIASWGGDLPHGVGMELYWNPSMKNARGIGGTTPQSLAERFYNDKKEPLTQGIGYGYHGAQILFDAIERAGTLDPEAVVKAISETDLITMSGRAVFEKGTQFQRFQCAFGQWRKTDKPRKWESPTVFSYSDSFPVTADMIFPMPYD
jgi:branched-chain amino acid transport system substrate-binding protein